MKISDIFYFLINFYVLSLNYIKYLLLKTSNINFIKKNSNLFFTFGPLVQAYLDELKKAGVTKLSIEDLYYLRWFSYIDAKRIKSSTSTNISTNLFYDNLYTSLQLSSLLIITTCLIISGFYILNKNIEIPEWIIYNLQIKYLKIKNLFKHKYEINYKSSDKIKDYTEKDTIIIEYNNWCNDYYLQLELYWDLILVNMNNYLILVDHALYFSCSF